MKEAENKIATAGCVCDQKYRIGGGEECTTWREWRDREQEDRLCLQLAFYQTLVTNTNNIALRAFNQWNRQMNVWISEWINKWMIVSMSMWGRGEYLFVCKWKYRPSPEVGNGRIHGLGYTVICSTLYVVCRETLHTVCCEVGGASQRWMIIESSGVEVECNRQCVVNSRSAISG